MHAVVEIESLMQDWKPPFAKKRDTKSFTVNEGETLEMLKDGTPLFTIKSIQDDRILLGYSRMYTLKGYEHPTERQLWLGVHDSKKFSSLWGDNGVTKTVTLREVKTAGDENTSPPPVEESPPEPVSEPRSSGRGMSSSSNADSEIYRPN